MTHESRTSQKRQSIRQPMVRIRELDAVRPGTLVMATSSPAPRYFLRVPGGWHAADAHGCTALQRILSAELEGWPDTLPSDDIRRPAVIVAHPDELDPALPELADLAAHAELMELAAAVGVYAA